MNVEVNKMEQELKITKKQQAENEKNDAIKELKELFVKGNMKAYTVLKHVSRSGMMRHIDVIVVVDGKPRNINWFIEKLGLYNRAKNYDAKHADSLRVGGCGMDMGFDVVYNTSSVVFRGGYTCLGEKCMGNDHHNKPYPEKDGMMHHDDGGYAVKQEWL